MKPVEIYLRQLNDLHISGAVDPSAYQQPLAGLLADIGQTLKPKVRCLLPLEDNGAGLPDGGLFTVDQFPKGKSAATELPETPPSRGVIVIRSLVDDFPKAAHSMQVVKQLSQYRQVLVTNYRAFVLMGLDAEGQPVALETYTLAETEEAFWTQAANPTAAAKIHGRRLIDYLQRVVCYSVAPARPAEVVWFLAAYAREAWGRIDDALAFVGAAQETLRQTLDNIRLTLETSLELAFEGNKGDRFFHATLVQSLFYALFAAWVLWHDENPARQDRFSWRMAPWYLNLPSVRALFEQFAPPEATQNGSLEELLDWASQALNRVERAEFFAHFVPEQAIQQFFEPFLRAFSPWLCRTLGVWYTPPEVARYVVVRVDAILRQAMGLAEGLADEQVYVLDPCCGTGTYLVEFLNHIAAQTDGYDDEDQARRIRRLRRAATQRLIGFEILPASFIIAHWQLSLRLQHFDAPLGDSERAGVYLTNALTGWQPPKAPVKPSELALEAFQSERDAANALKRGRKMLVVLGTPPPNNLPGVTVAQERDLAEVYRPGQSLPGAQPLNEPYVGFFRLAERHIAEQSGQGVVCYLSPYTWLDSPAFRAMRERYLTAFDQIWIDCLNGDKYQTGNLTPEGEPDPNVFATSFNRVGTAIGAVITTLLRQAEHQPTQQIHFRDLWGESKYRQLLDTAAQTGETEYERLPLQPKLKLPFMPAKVAAEYFTWPLLPNLFPVSFPGLKTSLDNVVVDIDRERLRRQMEKSFSPAQMRDLAPKAMETPPPFDGKASRGQLLERNIVRYCYRPFDMRWLYWESEANFLERHRPDYLQQLFNSNNVWLEARPRQRVARFDRGYVVSVLADNFGNGVSRFFPLYLAPADVQLSLFRKNRHDLQPNLSNRATVYLEKLETTTPHLFYHTVAILHTPHYRRENAGALRQNWPRIPLPNSERLLRQSAVLGRKIAMLLNPDVPVVEVTARQIRPDLQVMGVLKREDEERLDPKSDLILRASWGYAGRRGIVLPGPGQVVERSYTSQERAAIEKGAATLGLSLDQLDKYLGLSTCDVYLNEGAYWSNVPLKVWEYTLGSYQVIKKWLSYREEAVLGRPLKADEAQEVTHMTRRIATILLMTPALDANYQAVKKRPYPWVEGK